MKLEIEYAGGRDMYAQHVECKCLDPNWSDKPTVAHLFKRKIRLSGYDDNNFYDYVHKEPKNAACECGRKFSYQWFRSHVEFNWED